MMPPFTGSQHRVQGPSRNPTTLPQSQGDWVNQNVAKLATTPTPPPTMMIAERGASSCQAYQPQTRDIQTNIAK